MTKIDADKAIELLEKCYIEPANDVREIFHNMGVGAALSEIRHLKEEAEADSNDERCKWILYDGRTICPKGHTDKCDGSTEKPYWRLPDRYKELIKFCPYCGKEIDYTDIDKEITRRG